MFSRLRLPIDVALGAATVSVAATTMVVDDILTTLLEPYPGTFVLTEILVLVSSSVLAVVAFTWVIGRPIRLLARYMQHLAESPVDSTPPLFTSPLREIHQLAESILMLRSRLLADEQRALRLASDMLQVAKASGEWLWREDANFRFTELVNVNAKADVSAMVEKRIGMTRREIANHPADRAALEDLQHILDARGMFRDFRYRRAQADGTVNWYSTSGIPTFNEDMTFAGYRGTSRDITAEMQAQEQHLALTMLNSRLASATGQSADGVVLTDPTQAGNPIVYVNRAFCRITGHDAVQLLGQPSGVLGADCVDEIARARLTEAIEAGRRYQGLIPSRRQDGAVFWNDLSISSVSDEQGQITGFVWIFCDVSKEVEQEQKEAKDATRNAQFQKMESLGTLAGGIAHDLNNTLVPVLGLSKLLLEDANEGSPIRRPLQAIFGASERARDLVRQILDFSRVGGSELQAIDLVHELRKISTVIRAALPATAVLNFALEAPKLRVLFEPAKLYQILMNLCVNSFDALPEGKGSVSVTLVKDEALNRAHLTIRDDGAGMSKETLDRAFEPFFTTKEVGKGTGLGLSIIHGIVVSAGGDVQIASQPGQGTTVEIWLPLLKDDGQGTVAGARNPASASMERTA